MSAERWELAYMRNFDSIPYAIVIHKNTAKNLYKIRKKIYFVNLMSMIDLSDKNY